MKKLILSGLMICWSWLAVAAPPVVGNQFSTNKPPASALAVYRMGQVFVKTNHTSTNGYSSDGVHFTMPPTNSGVIGDAIFVTSVVGNLMSTKYANPATNGPALTNTLSFKINGGGGVIPPTFLSFDMIPYTCTIDHVTILASPSGSAVIEVMTCTTNVFDGGVTHPVSADKITASAPPTLTTANVSQDGTLTGWKTVLTNNQVIAFQVTSSTTVTNLVVSLHVTHSP